MGQILNYRLNSLIDKSGNNRHIIDYKLGNVAAGSNFVFAEGDYIKSPEFSNVHLLNNTLFFKFKVDKVLTEETSIININSGTNGYCLNIVVKNGTIQAKLDDKILNFLYYDLQYPVYPNMEYTIFATKSSSDLAVTINGMYLGAISIELLYKPENTSHIEIRGQAGVNKEIYDFVLLDEILSIEELKNNSAKVHAHFIFDKDMNDRLKDLEISGPQAPILDASLAKFSKCIYLDIPSMELEFNYSFRHLRYGNLAGWFRLDTTDGKYTLFNSGNALKVYIDNGILNVKYSNNIVLYHYQSKEKIIGLENKWFNLIISLLDDSVSVRVNNTPIDLIITTLPLPTINMKDNLFMGGEGCFRVNDFRIITGILTENEFLDLYLTKILEYDFNHIDNTTNTILDNTVYSNNSEKLNKPITLSDENGYVPSVTKGRSMVMDVDSDNEVVLPATVSLSESFTINLVIYKYVWEEINNYDIVSCTDGCGFGLSFRNVNNTKSLVLSGSVDGVNVQENTVPASAVDQAWTMFTLVCENNKMNLYLNGILVTDVDMHGSFEKHTNGNIVIGKNASRGNDSMNGMVDNVQVYSSALSGPNVRSLYSMVDRGTTNASTSVSKKELVCHYPLIDNFKDYTGNYGDLVKNVGTGATPVVKYDGRFGRCYDLTNCSLKTPEPFKINLDDANDMMVSAVSFCYWIKSTSLLTDHQSASGLRNYGVFGNAYAGGNAVKKAIMSEGLIGQAPEQVNYNMACHCTPANSNNYNVSKVAESLRDIVVSTDKQINGWTHYCCVKNGKDIKMFKNGKFLIGNTQSQFSVMLNCTEQPLCIGNASISSNSWMNFPGCIQDVRVYNYALCEKEIYDIAKAEYVHYTFNDENDEIPNYFLANLPQSDANYTVEDLGNATYKITCVNPIPNNNTRYSIPCGRCNTIEVGDTVTISFKLDKLFSNCGYLPLYANGLGEFTDEAYPRADKRYSITKTVRSTNPIEIRLAMEKNHVDKVVAGDWWVVSDIMVTKTDGCYSGANISPLDTTHKKRMYCFDSSGFNNHAVPLKVDRDYDLKTDYVKARYIRSYLNGNNLNEFCHWLRMEVYNEANVNVALNKTVTASFVAGVGTGKSPLSALTSSGFVNTSEPYIDCSASSTTPQWIQVDLGSVMNITKIGLQNYFADNRIYEGNKIQTSENEISWKTHFDSIVEGNYPSTQAGRYFATTDPNMYRRNLDRLCLANISQISNCKLGDKALELKDSYLPVGNNNMADSVRARYVRSTLFGSTENAANQWIRMEIYNEANVNVAINKPVSSSFISLTGVNKSPLNALTISGFITSSVQYIDCGGSNDPNIPHWVQVDLGSVMNITKVGLQTYFTDTRAFHGNMIQTSIDGVNWVTHYDSDCDGEYASTQAGRYFDMRSPTYLGDQVTFNQWVYGNTFSNTTPTNRCCLFKAIKSSGTAIFSYYNANAFVFQTAVNELGGTANIIDTSRFKYNDWNMISYTYDKKSLKIRSYINGVFQRETTGPANTFIEPGEINIAVGGGRNSQNSEDYHDYSNIKVDDFRIFQTVLTDGDIMDLYQTRASLDSNGNLTINQCDEKQNLAKDSDVSFYKLGNVYYPDNAATFTPDYSKFGVSLTASVGASRTNKGYKIFRPKNTTNGAWGAWFPRIVPGVIRKGRRYRLETDLNGIIGSILYISCSGAPSWTNVAGFVSVHSNVKQYWLSQDSKQIAMNETPISGTYVFEFTCDKNTIQTATKTEGGYNTGDRRNWASLPSVSFPHQSNVNVNSEFYITGLRLYDITDEKNTNGLIPISEKSSVEASEIKRTGTPVGYIRIRALGNTVNNSGHCVELEAFDRNGCNVAYKKPIFNSNNTAYSDGDMVDGSYSILQYTDVTDPRIIDLGGIYDIDKIRMMLYPDRIYNNVTLDISVDKTNWINVYDSERDGRYSEGAEAQFAASGGRIFYLNNDTMSMNIESKVLYVGGLDTK